MAAGGRLMGDGRWVMGHDCWLLADGCWLWLSAPCRARSSRHCRYIRGAVREGWLVKQGGRIKTWRRRWVVLASGGVLYYFDDPKAAAPKVLRLSQTASGCF